MRNLFHRRAALRAYGQERSSALAHIDAELGENGFFGLENAVFDHLGNNGVRLVLALLGSLEIAVLEIRHYLLEFFAHKIICAADGSVRAHCKSGEESFIEAVIDNDLSVELLEFLKREHIA